MCYDVCAHFTDLSKTVHVGLHWYTINHCVTDAHTHVTQEILDWTAMVLTSRSFSYGHCWTVSDLGCASKDQVCKRDKLELVYRRQIPILNTKLVAT